MHYSTPFSAAIFSIVIAGPLAAQSFSIEAFGGISNEDVLTNGSTDYPTKQGSWYGIRGLYSSTSNMAFGMEYNRSEAAYDDDDGDSVNSMAVMAIARYSMPIHTNMTAYGTIGLGTIEVEYDGGTTWSNYSGKADAFGGQLTLGTSYAFTPNVSGILEVSYQNAFDDVIIEGENIEYKSTNIAFGVGYKF